MGEKFVIQFTLHNNTTKTLKLMTHRHDQLTTDKAKVDSLLEWEPD